MTKREIQDMFDRNPNMTVRQLARIAGKPEHLVVRILMEKM